MKKHFNIICVILLCLILSGCSCKHEWINATCSSPVICSKCGEKAGAPLEHIWEDATCAAPKTCKLCGLTEGLANTHNWNDATCDAPQMCSLCGITAGTAIGHKWESSSCDSPQVCQVCGTTGVPAGHKLSEPTCTEPSKCTVCGAKEGTALGHTNPNGICSRCGKESYDINNVLKIYGTYIFVDSADGVSVYLTWENKSQKEIKYIYFRVELYNRVNEQLDCDITGKMTYNLKQTGPIPYGKGMYDCCGVSHGSMNDRYFISSKVSYEQYRSDEENHWAGRYWDNIWYNSEAHYVKITGVQIEYMDGTEYSVLDKNVFDKMGIINVTQSQSIYDYL